MLAISIVSLFISVVMVLYLFELLNEKRLNFSSFKENNLCFGWCSSVISGVVWYYAIYKAEKVEQIRIFC